MKFPYCNFSWNHKLIVGLHTLHASKSRANVVVVLMHLLYSHSTNAISKECVLKYGKNSYANIFTIWMYLGTTVS